MILKSVDTLWLISLTFKVFAVISSNFAFVNKPALVVDADANVALVPSLEFTSTVVSVAVPSDKSVDTLWLISLTLAVLASISSNKPGDNKPDTDVVASGITALVPSEETIVLAPVVPVILKSVDTLWLISLTFKVFATISSNFAFVNKPALVVEADTKVALLPSLEFTSTVVVVEVPSLRLVDTLWLISLTLAVLAATAELLPTSVSKSDISDAAKEPLNTALSFKTVSTSESPYCAVPVIVITFPLSEIVIPVPPLKVTSSFVESEPANLIIDVLDAPACTFKSYDVSSVDGSVTVLTFNAVTCPLAEVVTESIAVNVPPYEGELVDVVSVLEISLWFIVIVSFELWFVVKLPPVPKSVPAVSVIVALLAADGIVGWFCIEL